MNHSRASSDATFLEIAGLMAGSFPGPFPPGFYDEENEIRGSRKNGGVMKLGPSGGSWTQHKSGRSLESVNNFLLNLLFMGCFIL